MSFSGSKVDNWFFGFGKAPMITDADLQAANRVNQNMRPLRKALTLINAGLSGYTGYVAAVAAAAGGPVAIPAIAGAVVGRAILGGLIGYVMSGVGQEFGIAVACDMAEHNANQMAWERARQS